MLGLGMNLRELHVGLAYPPLNEIVSSNPVGMFGENPARHNLPFGDVPMRAVRETGIDVADNLLNHVDLEGVYIITDYESIQECDHRDEEDGNHYRKGPRQAETAVDRYAYHEYCSRYCEEELQPRHHSLPEDLQSFQILQEDRHIEVGEIGSLRSSHSLPHAAAGPPGHPDPHLSAGRVL